MITLRFATLDDREEFNKFLKEDWEETFIPVHYLHSLCNESFEKYIELAPLWQKGEGNQPKEHVNVTAMFAFNNKNEIVGRTSIRHELNKDLLEVGGHIGYGVAPSHRKKGYATAILAESLKWMQQSLSHIDKALVTCNEENIGSYKVIEKNGGVLEDIRLVGEENIKRYWIDL